MVNDINETFNQELDKYQKGELSSSHVFKLGMPGEILQNTGFPICPIELIASRLNRKAGGERHPFDITDIKSLVSELNNPLAVFEYGAIQDTQNVILALQREGKNFLVGVHFNQNDGKGNTISSIRTLFSKNHEKWLGWINQGRLLYADIKKLQETVNQQRTNLADVAYLDLEHIDSILEANKNVKHFYTEKAPILQKKGFYRLSDAAFKELYYARHLQLAYSTGEFTPVIVTVDTTDKKLHIEEYSPANVKRVLNPFSETDRKIINEAGENGVLIPASHKAELLASLEECLPNLHRAIKSQSAEQARPPESKPSKTRWPER